MWDVWGTKSNCGWSTKWTHSHPTPHHPTNLKLNLCPKRDYNPGISVLEWKKTIHALHRAATETHYSWFPRFVITYRYQLALSWCAEFPSACTGTAEAPIAVSVRRAESATTNADRATPKWRTPRLCYNQHERTGQEQSHTQLRHFHQKVVNRNLKGATGCFK
jgi:hypothetical protein